LSAQVGLALILAVVAAGILNDGLNRIVDGASYRLSGIIRIGIALSVYGGLILFWGIGGGLIGSG
jgi:hypothetical protein